MKRKIYTKLLEWKNNSKGSTALLVEGARRIGKSYIVNEFGKNEYKSYILVDFNDMNSDLRDIFENYLSKRDEFFIRLSLHYGIKLYERNSLIIFDEVQQYPQARAAIKYLVADGRYDYIETGSLVSIKKNVKNIVVPSEEEHISMFPMDLEEFLWALGDDMTMDFVRNQFRKLEPMGSLHRKMMDYFRQYMVIGGMPQAVLEYAKSKDFSKVDKVKRNILRLYRDDIAKYATGAESKAIAIFDEIPPMLQRHERKFSPSSIKEGSRMREYEDAFFWLSDSRVVNICYNSTEPNIGLRMNMDRTTLKCYLGDTGLLISMAFDENTIASEQLYKKLILGKLEVNLGMLMENIVAQMLVSSGHKLYFYSNSDKVAENRMEIDFLIGKPTVTSRHNICPLEVKSTTRYTFTSLEKFRKKYAQQLSVPYLLHTADVMQQDGIVFLPIYMASVL
ncbi:MAG: AAA family ATPase [Bacteroidales bacterium]|nr:AAA family ATPase [Bacteroidales bacterium]